MKKLSFLLILSMIFLGSCKDDEDKITRTLDAHADWMTSLIVENGNAVTLRNLSIPAAHDAGMYTLSSCSLGANACSTQTQDQDMTAMLNAGVRIFDIRPTFKNGGYYTEHVTECNGLGCQGDLFDNTLEQTRTFLDSHSELVIYIVTHFCDTNSSDNDLINLIENKLGERLYKTVSNGDFIDMPIEDMVDAQGGKGKVLLVYEDAANETSLMEKGIFPSSFIPLEGSYSNSFDFEYMKADQIQKFNNFNPSGNKVFEMSWTMTLDTELSVACFFPVPEPQSIQDFALVANAQLGTSVDGFIADGTFTKNKIPNIIWVDFADKFVTDACKKITALNFE